MDLSMAIIKSDIIMAEQGIHLFKDRGIKEIKNQTAYFSEDRYSGEVL